MKLERVLMVCLLVSLRTLAMDEVSQNNQSQNTAVNPIISVGLQGATTITVARKLLSGYEEWRWDGLKLVYRLQDESPN